MKAGILILSASAFLLPAAAMAQAGGVGTGAAVDSAIGTDPAATSAPLPEAGAAGAASTATSDHSKSPASADVDAAGHAGAGHSGADHTADAEGKKKQRN